MASTNTSAFLDNFTGDLPQIFQSKDDGQGTKDTEITSKYGKIWHKTGSLEDVGQWLENNNKYGWGAFFVVNELDQSLDSGRKRTEKMLVRLRAIWCEDDNKRDKPRTDWPIKPNIIVNSSPGKFHYYWITSTKNVDEWRGVMQTMVDSYGCDNNAKDPVRVLRLPGFYHMKRIDSPHMVDFSQVRKTPYTWKAIKEAFPPSIPRADTTSEALEKSDTLTKTTSELILDYDEGHRHGPSAKMAMKLANYNMPFDEILPILTRLFPDSSLDHHTQSITSAIEKIRAEQSYTFYESGGRKKKTEAPHFDTSFAEDWPEPWPMIFKAFKDCIYHVISEIYVPSCFNFHTVMLGGVFRTIRGRGPNLNLQIISASGVGKDSNTTEPIERIVSYVKRSWGEGASDADKLGFRLISPIYESVTADTTYLKTLNFEENQDGGLILNTEASGHWDMVANADNPHTEGVMRIEINAWDGHHIAGKVVGGARYADITNPNYSMLRLQQTEALERNLTQRMIDIGLGNRIDYYADNIDRPETASTELSSKEVSVNEEYADFIRFIFKFIYANKSTQIKVITSDHGGVINRFENEVLLPLVNNKKVGRDEYKFIKRIIGSAEKQVTVIAAFAYIWGLYYGRDVSGMVLKKVGDVVIEIDGSEFEKYALPLMEYQLKIRRHLHENVLNTSQATAETEALNEVWERCVAKVSPDYKPWHDQGGIVAAHFHARVKAHKFFSKNKKYDDPERIKRAINSWAIENGLEMKKIEVHSKKKTCYVF